ncbi:MULTISPECIES: methyltransferase domain-containing protein [unclassified Amycolatopsis]|uniref:methyltransferase domain-containing protein n=1 Tax=unclassified Amycolatopsis TaxID=2618356 RepID=UPI002E0F3E1B|nr:MULTISPECIES: methyltransferase domain-containing protein [unclassified Amycolatopsis]WSK81585.1 methyltransferase domain-containing protein [Amycolatopsis sp. NBC_01286]
MLEGYAPGYGRDAVSMMSARTAAERATFAQPLFGPGMWVVDLGCGPGSITLGLGAGSRVTGVDRDAGQVAMARDSARRAGRSTVDFVVASAYALPFDDGCVDVAFSHALFEHLAAPVAALAELRRVLKPGGRLALSTSDWSKARLRPKTANVDAALRGHYLLRRRAGGDPFAGRKIADHCAAAGFAEIVSRPRYREDMTYRDLARYVESRLDAAISDPDYGRDRDQLASAARSAWTWVRSGDGDFSQCWVELTATR